MIMSEENQEMEQQFVEIYGEDGQIVKCEIYDVIDFEDKTYALLLPVTEDEEDDDSEVIVMEYIEEGEDGYFQNIEDEEEFKKVCAFIESLDDEEDEQFCLNVLRKKLLMQFMKRKIWQEKPAVMKLCRNISY